MQIGFFVEENLNHYTLKITLLQFNMGNGSTNNQCQSSEKQTIAMHFCQ
ncbi:Uncharacterised protein [Prevotella disiens]|uniref:Uncharacterized protein n=1 Tax=Prevotella disiens TaxID=28130 RepID=A0A379EFM9_9BACT|nr:Uncharacterised protein [Prevotella disiens]